MSDNRRAVSCLSAWHLGDGNLHYLIRTPQARAAMERPLQIVVQHGGSISDEHGIGVDKKPWLHLSRSPAEILAMRRLKAAFDPRSILHRDKIFDHGAAGSPTP